MYNVLHIFSQVQQLSVHITGHNDCGRESTAPWSKACSVSPGAVSAACSTSTGLWPHGCQLQHARHGARHSARSDRWVIINLSMPTMVPVTLPGLTGESDHHPQHTHHGACHSAWSDRWVWSSISACPPWCLSLCQVWQVSLIITLNTPIMVPVTLPGLTGESGHQPQHAHHGACHSTWSDRWVWSSPSTHPPCCLSLYLVWQVSQPQHAPLAPTPQFSTGKWFLQLSYLIGRVSK